MMRSVVLGASLVVAVAVFSSGSPADAQQTASRIVDRTFVCTPIAFGGVRDLDLRAGPTRTDPRTIPRTIPAKLVVRTGTTARDNDLVVVRARVHAAVGAVTRDSGPAGVFAHDRRCSPSRASVPLTSKGLPGAPAAWYSEVTCSLRGRALVHVRARLAAPAEWRRTDETHLGARERVEEAWLAVRSERTGEPLAFMQVDKAGKTRLWTAPRCT